MNKINNIPVWQKWTLTVKEAAQYFGIGENKIRDIINENIDSGIVLRVGNRWLIKRHKFEEFIDECDVL